VLLQLLLLANLFTPMFTININILNAQGLSTTSLKLEIIKKSLILISIIICFQWGIKAMLIGFIAANFVSYLFSMIYIKKSLFHYFRHQLSDLTSRLFIAILCGTMIFLLSNLNLSTTLQLLIQSFVFLLIYLILNRFIFPNEFKEILQKILSRTRF
jgi:O-antigen/teichoic acid export membrane protein